MCFCRDAAVSCIPFNRAMKIGAICYRPQVCIFGKSKKNAIAATC
jgi:hypothetical protein